MNTHNISCTLICADGSRRQLTPDVTHRGGGFYELSLPLSRLTGGLSIDFCDRLVSPVAGDEGYFVLPQGTQNRPGGVLTYFKDRPDCEYDTRELFMSLFGVRHPDLSYMAFVTGLPYRCRIAASVREGRYSICARFDLTGELYEEPRVIYRLLDYGEADFSSMANYFRGYILEHGLARPLSERQADCVRYATSAPYIRIRQAWKPVPSPVAEQTEENEPPIHVACDFDRVIDIMEGCHARGVRAAEFCLVGWNRGGHDGRWPQVFPAEPALGGEEGLRRVIARAGELGYTVSCHTNSTEIYSIADNFDETATAIRADGSQSISEMWWGGGRPRLLCPARALDYAEELLPRLAEYKFTGIHYIDVLSIIPPVECHSPLHPMNSGEAAEAVRQIGRLCASTIGGYSSEGGREHSMSVLDYLLYRSFGSPFEAAAEKHPFTDRYIPLWESVYHGLVLYNSFTETVNYCVKEPRVALTALEYGVRPSFYFHSKFLTDPNRDWMGQTDLRCETDAELERSLDLLAAACAEFEETAYLQTLYITCWQQEGEGDRRRSRVTYSDGSVMEVDYGKNKATLTRGGRES